MFKHVLAAIAAAVLVAPGIAQAQSAPSYARGADETIHGRIQSFDGAYHLTVRDDRGYVDDVTMHQGTIINPTGLTLQPGMVVSIDGFNAGRTFAANEIDTPYSYYAGIPYFAGRPWFAYGPSVDLGFYFGHPGWYHGGWRR